MKNIIIGTAGHVDHGKTMLIKALTGIDTDRLKTEQERGISIELGFANLQLPDDQNAGIIDVPGHERFIKNMLAGVGSIDIVILVIAADEGVMPQTKEHLDIIQLLMVNQGVVVITKTDLVDQEWLDLVCEDVNEFLKGTVMEGAPLITVSSTTGAGLDELIQLINELALNLEKRKFSGPPRIPVDRVFSVTGFGTVATGTLLSGQISIGENLQIYPKDAVYRVRNIQVHGKKVDMAQAGQRVAINLSGLEIDDLGRGFTLATPGALQTSYRLDIKLNFLPDAPKPLKNRARVRVYLGTAEVLGRVLLLDREELQPGEYAYAQLQLEAQVAAARGDYFVIRSYSPMRTIGGGVVINPDPVKHKRNKKEVIQALITAETGTPAELLEQHLAINSRMFTFSELSIGTGISKEDASTALQELVNNGEAIAFESEGEKVFLSQKVLAKWDNKIMLTLTEYHEKYPLRIGYPKEEMRSRLFSELSSKQFQMLLNYLEKNNKLTGYAKSIFLSGYQPQPSPKQSEKINQLEKVFLANPFQPPSWGDAIKDVGIIRDDQEYLNYLLTQGILVKVDDGIYFHNQAIQQAVDLIKEYLEQKSEISLGETRDLLKTSRKYALPLLGWFDREKITRRVGDVRVPGKLFAENQL